MKPSVTAAIRGAIPILLTACYGAAPPKPATIPLPALHDDAELVVHSETKTTIKEVAKSRWPPRSLDRLRSSKSEVRHLVTPSGARRYSAIGLDGWSRTRSHDLQVDQYPAAVRDWISPPCGSRCRREVDLP
jgi:hypothetical protein